MSSYTVIDTLFGGHLLSSVVCDECHCCMQRLEAFLDLSLPIVDDESSRLELEESFNKRQPSRSCKKNESLQKSSSKKSAQNVPVIAEATAKSPSPNSKKEDFLTTDSNNIDTSKMSKHQIKKMAKQNKKATKAQVKKKSRFLKFQNFQYLKRMNFFKAK